MILKIYSLTLGDASVDLADEHYRIMNEPMLSLQEVVEEHIQRPPLLKARTEDDDDGDNHEDKLSGRSEEDEEAARTMSELSSQEFLIECMTYLPLKVHTGNNDDDCEDILARRSAEDEYCAVDPECDGSDPAEFDLDLAHNVLMRTLDLTEDTAMQLCCHHQQKNHRM